MGEHRVASLAELEENRPTDAEAGGTEILLVRRGDTVHALAAHCPHRGVPLSKGIVDGDAIVCGVHRAAFSLETGELLSPPACESLARHEVRIDGDDVYVTLAGTEAHPLPTMAKRGTDTRRFVVVGSGGAGWRAAETLRREGFEGAITVVADEGGAPYDRTELSKTYLKPAEGGEPEDPVLREPAAAEAHDIDVVVGRATGLDPKGKRLTLEGAPVDGLDYDALLIATGCDARSLDVPGSDAPGIHTIRSLGDAKALRRDLAAVRERADGGTIRAVIVGAGFVGLEAATSLSAHDDVSVTLTMPDELPMAGKFGEDFARRLKSEHEDAGVTFRTGAETTGFATDGEGGRVSGVELDDGTTIEADIVVVAVGAAPRTGWLPFETEEDGGIAVEAGLGVPGADGVWLAGDIARVPTDWGKVRIEHWRFAQECGEIAARNMLGGNATYEGTPFFWSAQQIAGSYMWTGHVGDDPETEGDVAPTDFALRFVERGKLAAVLSHGIDDEITRLVPKMAGTGPLAADAGP